MIILQFSFLFIVAKGQDTVFESLSPNQRRPINEANQLLLNYIEDYADYASGSAPDYTDEIDDYNSAFVSAADYLYENSGPLGDASLDSTFDNQDREADPIAQPELPVTESKPSVVEKATPSIKEAPSQSSKNVIPQGSSKEVIPLRPRPNDNMLLGKALNSGVDTAGGKDGGFNQCLKCTGETADKCRADGVMETCNDAQDACIVEVRSQYRGRRVQHMFYAGCKSLVSCNYERARNFERSDSYHDKCRSTRMHSRFYPTSHCTFCTKLGNPSNSTSVLFGVSDNEISINTTHTILISELFSDPASNIVDFYTENDWY